MTEERMTPLRRRMIEDMNIRGLGEKTQKAHISNVKHFAAFLGRSPDTATPEELRSYQLKMTEDGTSASTFNVRIISLRFFFGITCGHEEMKRFMQFHRKPRKLPIVLSVEEVADLLAAVPGPGLKYRAALGISYGAGLRASEVCNLKVTDIDSGRMLIHVDDGKAPFGGPEAVLTYLSRYTHRVAISNSRLISADENAVAFRWKDYRIKSVNRTKVMRLATPEFIRRFLIHVLPDGFHRIRHYGFLASSTRKPSITKIRSLLCVQRPEQVATPKAEAEVIPLMLREPCPCCAGPMRIIETFRRGQRPMSRAPPREQVA